MARGRTRHLLAGWTVHGPAGGGRWGLRAHPPDFDGFTIEVDRIVGCGETVLVEARYRATAKATGKELDAQVAHIWDFRDGKLVHWQQYTDTWQFADATEFSPALAAGS